MAPAISQPNISRIFLDSAAVIYYVEQHPTYFAAVHPIFEQIDQGNCTAVTSPITLAECLIHPYRKQLQPLQEHFTRVIVGAKHTTFQPCTAEVGRLAATLRVDYNLALADALQIATAVTAKCDAFLSNDKMLRRVTELQILLVEDLVPSA